MVTPARSRNLALFFLLGAALVGGVLGFSADRLVTRERVCRWGDQAGMRRLFGDELGLNADQRAIVDSLLDDKHRQIAAVVRPVKPQLDSISDRTADQINRLLTPAQRPVFDVMRRTAKANEDKYNK